MKWVAAAATAAICPNIKSEFKVNQQSCTGWFWQQANHVLPLLSIISFTHTAFEKSEFLGKAQARIKELVCSTIDALLLYYYNCCPVNWCSSSSPSTQCTATINIASITHNRERRGRSHWVQQSCFLACLLLPKQREGGGQSVWPIYRPIISGCLQEEEGSSSNFDWSCTKAHTCTHTLAHTDWRHIIV